MYKIVEAVNSMIENAHLIGHVLPYEVGFLFTYNEKYKWSISKDDEEYFLLFYPGQQTLTELVSSPNKRHEYSVAYNTMAIKTREARESFAELYQVVQNKYYGIDSVLDDIINTAA